MTPLEDTLRESAEAVDLSVESLVPAPDGVDGRLFEAMRYSLFAGGKRLRPFLVLSGADPSMCRAAWTVNTAAAIEMVHTYSLVHDDLPAMDDDDLRRGNTDLPCRLRRGDGDPGRRCPPHPCLRGGDGAGGAPGPCEMRDSSSPACWRGPPAAKGWPAARPSTSRRRVFQLTLDEWGISDPAAAAQDRMRCSTSPARPAPSSQVGRRRRQGGAPRLRRLHRACVPDRRRPARS